jgi:hypothetical protein
LIVIDKRSPYAVDRVRRRMTHHRLRLIRLFARARRPEDTLLASSIRALFERADDRTHGITNISGPPYNDITIQYTVYKPATVSEQINAVADAAAKTGELVTARAEPKGPQNSN